MKVQFTDNGEIIEADTFRDVVNYMRETAVHLNAETNHEYMMGYAQRAVILNDEDIRATSEDEFMIDLMRYDHMRILEFDE